MIDLVAAIAGSIAFLLILAAWAKRPWSTLLIFLCLYAPCVIGLFGAFLEAYVKAHPAFPLALQDLWGIWRVLGAARMVFLVLFVHSFHTYRHAPIVVAAAALLSAVAAILPFFAYSLFPLIIEIAIVYYSFAYLLYVYRSRGRLGLSARRSSLARTVLACNAFFLIGITLDFAEAIPAAGSYVSIALFDFYPLYLACAGAVVAVWAIRESFFVDRRGAGTAPAGAVTADTAVKAFSLLSPREREVIAPMLRGETNAAIARALFISESTVKKHVNHVFRKLGIRSRWELLKIAKDQSNEADASAPSGAEAEGGAV
jgi:DNA-binding CsgD family transcriptional regulator